MSKTLALMTGLLLASSPRADDSPSPRGLEGPVTLETRWWSVREFGFRLAEATGLRYAVVDGISGRGRVGGKEVPASGLTREFERKTRTRGELIGGVLAFHRPDETRRRDLEAKLAGGGDEAVRAAWLLGWLKDAGAWPALAKAAAGKDLALALSAAQALRRLDGEEEFDLRRWILPIYHDLPPDGGLWQTPLGACFPNVLKPEEVETLAASTWVPLREAATRLTPACGGRGKALVDRLKDDPSLGVRLAAQRALRAWESPPEGFKPAARAVKLPDLGAERANLDKGWALAKPAAARLATYGTDEDLRRLAELSAASGEIGSAATRGLGENGGGEIALAALRKDAAVTLAYRHAYAYSKYGLAMLLDGEALAKELGPLLGQDSWSVSSELLLGRLSGPAALPYLKAPPAKPLVPRGHVAPAAIGAIGGPDSVAILVPLLGSEDLSTALAAARGLGDTGSHAAVEPLLARLGHPDRLQRKGAALALGRIGGPAAAAGLASLLKSETDYLVRRAACSTLAEIGPRDPEQVALIVKVEKELAASTPRYRPQNKRFGADFPVGQWVELARPLEYICGAETRLDVDPFTGILFNFGG